MAESNPTVRQRELSMRLRKLREERNLTVGEVAELLECSPAKVSRIETGARRVGLPDVRDLCRIYGVSDHEVAQLTDLARRAREDGWWARYDDLGAEVGPYFDFEQEAKSITYYSMSFIYGPLQSDDYAKAIIRGVNPQIDDQVLKERVEARMRRHGLLERTDRPRVRVLMDEAVLHREVGGRKVMGAQLGRILDVAASEKVVVQIIPFSSGTQVSSDSNMTLFEFSDISMPAILHIEGLISAQYLDRAPAIDRYREALDQLRDAALPPRESQVLITKIKDAHDRAA